MNFRTLVDRDTALTAVTILPSAYTWIVTEKWWIGALVAVLLFALATLAHDRFAHRFHWEPLNLIPKLRNSAEEMLRLVRTHSKKA